MLRASIDAKAAAALLRDLDAGMDKVVGSESRSVGEEFVRDLRADRGVAPYQAVYAKLGRGAKIRMRAGRPPEIVIGGGRVFSGGGSIDELVGPYEYGSRTGDLKRGASARAGQAGRRRGRRTNGQLPPRSSQGLWVNAMCERWEDGPLADAWAELLDRMVDDVARKDHG